MLVVITGGGTGGHIYPGLAVSSSLRENHPGASVIFIGSKSGPEGEAARDAGLPFEGLDLSGLVGKNPASAVRAIARFALGTIRCFRLLRRTRPLCVLGTGGYAAAPACFAAVVTGIPLILHEMNLKPGLVTRVLAARSYAVACAHAGTAGMLSSRARPVVTGIPVRPEIEALGGEEKRNSARARASAGLGVFPDRRTMLVFGGSQGAEALNAAVWETVPRFADRDDLQVIHITGRRDFEDPRRAEAEGRMPGGGLLYRAIPYLEQMELAYSIADLAVTRAGAGTLAELRAARVPSVLVPYPHSSAGHQESNARQLAETGAAVVVLQSGSSAVTAVLAAFELVFDDAELESMLKAADRLAAGRSAQGILDIIEELS